MAGRTGPGLIGNQSWTLTNLDVTTYRNGDIIPQVTSFSTWANLTTGAWCWYGNSEASGSKYGRLYNSYAVKDSRGLAPIGWHVATQAEWSSLFDKFGGINAAAPALRSKGTDYWTTNTGTNQSSMNIRGGGVRNNIEVVLGDQGFYLEKTWAYYYASNATNLYRVQADITQVVDWGTILSTRYGAYIRIIKNT